MEGRLSGGEGGRGERREQSYSKEPDQKIGRALVIGLGNPLRGDDGIGPAVIEALQPEGPGLTLVESAGNDLVEWLASDEFDRIFVIDAADLGRAPGSWTRLTSDRLTEPSAGPVVHGLGLVQSLELVKALGLGNSAPLSIYAIQPAEAGWKPGLSPEAGGGVQAVAAAIRKELCLPDPPARLEEPRIVLHADEEVRSLSCSGKAK